MKTCASPILNLQEYYEKGERMFHFSAVSILMKICFDMSSLNGVIEMLCKHQKSEKKEYCDCNLKSLQEKVYFFLIKG